MTLRPPSTACPASPPRDPHALPVEHCGQLDHGLGAGGAELGGVLLAADLLERCGECPFQGEPIGP
ncbi:MAG: hypothetical protein HY721_21625 [Planctomycetes bacterium]|nr:hypothetical protein [Planctomycetota bacterium]